ncbi:hypothetical protein [Streptomyces sp. NPDC090029]|uniref:hypothetical protein n=1 Tax=Streptomyces sp. NPDC090029 TaxID=3365924 RepID=UPI0038152086
MTHAPQPRPPLRRSTTEQPAVITGIRLGLHIRTDTRPPVANWLCRCGHHERALGKEAVIELTSRVQVGHCPHTADQQAAPAAVGGPMGAARKGVRTVTDLHLPTATTADGRTAA